MHGYADPAVFGGGPAGKVDLERGHDFSTAERRARCTCAEQHLVDVVVQDLAEPVEILSAEANTHLLGDAVADRVRMTHALALDDLDGLRTRSASFGAADVEIQRGLPASLPSYICGLESIERWV
jgi:hypothetical protein